MKGNSRHVASPLRVIELASRKRVPIAGIGQRLEQWTRRGAPKLTHEVGTSCLNGNAELAAMIGEVDERRRRSEFLTLEEHRRARRKEPQRGHGSIQARVRLLMHARAEARRCVRYLIVVIE